MYPEKHLREIKRNSKKRKLYEVLGTSSAALSSVYLLGPLIHELSHIAVLKLFQCGYNPIWEFNAFQGLRAEVQPLCSLETPSLLLFYSVGYLSVLCIGGLLSLYSIELNKRESSLDTVVGGLGVGLMFSLFLSLGMKGDIQNSIQILGLPQSLSFLFYGIIIAIGGYVSILLMESHLGSE